MARAGGRNYPRVLGPLDGTACARPPATRLGYKIYVLCNRCGGPLRPRTPPLLTPSSHPLCKCGPALRCCHPAPPRLSSARLASLRVGEGGPSGSVGSPPLVCLRAAAAVQRDSCHAGRPLAFAPRWLRASASAASPAFATRAGWAKVKGPARWQGLNT